MNKKLLIALVVWAGYIGIIIFLPRLFSSGGTQSQADFASGSISPAHVIAVVYLLAFVLIAGWRKETGLKMPRPETNWLILWLPILFICLFFSLGLVLGFRSGPALVYAIVNTIAVGIGEELAFRGVIFAGAREQFNNWGSIFFTSVIFGAVHVLNGLGTGDYLAASVQAVAAMMSGLLFLALLVRTGSLIPGMIIHFLWDLSIFVTTRPGEHVGGEGSVAMRMILPILFVMPNFLYALYLLRGVSNTPSEELVA